MSQPFADVDRLLRCGGQSVSQISAATGVSWWRVYKYAKRHAIPLWSKRQPLTEGQQAEAIRLVEIEGLTLAGAAHRIGGSEMQVWRLITRRRSEIVIRAGEFRPLQVRTGRRCPRHGVVYVWPCVACHAIAATNPTKPSNATPTATPTATQTATPNAK